MQLSTLSVFSSSNVLQLMSFGYSHSSIWYSFTFHYTEIFHIEFVDGFYKVYEALISWSWVCYYIFFDRSQMNMVSVVEQFFLIPCRPSQMFRCVNDFSNHIRKHFNVGLELTNTSGFLRFLFCSLV